VVCTGFGKECEVQKTVPIGAKDTSKRVGSKKKRIAGENNNSQSTVPQLPSRRPGKKRFSWHSGSRVEENSQCLGKKIICTEKIRAKNHGGGTWSTITHKQFSPRTKIAKKTISSPKNSVKKILWDGTLQKGHLGFKFYPIFHTLNLLGSQW